MWLTAALERRAQVHLVRGRVGVRRGARVGLGFEKQPSAQKRPHGERPYLSTNLCAHACRKPLRSSAVHRYTEPVNMTIRWYGRSDTVP